MSSYIAVQRIKMRKLNCPNELYLIVKSPLKRLISLWTCTWDKFQTRTEFLILLSQYNAAFEERWGCWYTVQWFNKLGLGELILLVAHRHTNQDINAALFHAAQKRLSLWTSSFKPYPSHSYNLLILKLMIFTPWTEPEIVKTLMITCSKSYTEYQLYWNVTMFHTGYSKSRTKMKQWKKCKPYLRFLLGSHLKRD